MTHAGAGETAEDGGERRSQDHDQDDHRQHRDQGHSHDDAAGGHQHDPMAFRGDPYAPDAADRTVEVDVPALALALAPLGPSLSVAEAKALAEQNPVSGADRRRIIDQAILALSELYVHRDVKRIKHAADPVVALRYLKRRADVMAELDFQLELMRIFKSLRDIHTAYILPPPYSDMVAFLPFLLGAHKHDPEHNAGCAGQARAGEGLAPGDGEERCVIVTGLLANFQHPYFRPGVEVLSWNGLPIQRAIQRIGVEEQGSNAHAQRELGLRLMTVRWLGGSLPPDEYFVTVAYLDLDRRLREIRFPWRVIADPGERVASLQAMWQLKRKYERGSAETPSMEHRALVEHMVRQSLFSRQKAGETGVRRQAIDLPGLPEGVFQAWRVSVETDGEPFEFGLVRIDHFAVGPAVFRDAFAKILRLVPARGLAIDIRSNPGGVVSAAEGILQMLGPGPVTPLPFQFLATTLVEDLVRSHKSRAVAELKAWRERVAPAVENGYQFSRFGTLTAEADANGIGQRFHGSVVLLTNAVTYSSGDIFAASFQDHRIGTVIGVDPTTGGGGANMWWHNDETADYAVWGREIERLPAGAKMHYAIRRCSRVGDNAGLPIEEEGVAPDVVHDLTRRDLLHEDADLMIRAAEVLRRTARPAYEARISLDGRDLGPDETEVPRGADPDGPQIEVEILTDPADEPIEHFVFVDGRARQSVEARDGSARIPIRLNLGRPTELRIESHRIESGTRQSAGHFASTRRRFTVAEDMDTA